MPYLDVFNVPHFYTRTSDELASETTVVFVHGWLLSHCYWQPVIERLQSEFRCLSYDLRGFGLSTTQLDQRSHPAAASPSAPPAYSLMAYAEDLGELIEALNLNSVWLVGHSLGGSIALWAAKQFPQRVKGVICVNAGGGVYLPTEFEQFRNVGQQIVRWRPRWLAAIPCIDHLFASLMVFKPLAQTWGKQRVTDLLAADANAAVGSLLESTTETEVHLLPQVVTSLKQPVYFIAGEQDTVMEQQYVRHLASFHTLFKGQAGNVRVLQDCGHMAMVEQPDALAEMIQTLIHPDRVRELDPCQPSSSTLS